jgi:hypothetical protein
MAAFIGIHRSPAFVADHVGVSSSLNRGVRLEDVDRELLTSALEAAQAAGASVIALGDTDSELALGDAHDVLPRLPAASAELVVADPPYNTDKDFGSIRGKRMEGPDYEEYTRALLEAALPRSSPTGASTPVATGVARGARSARSMARA